MNTFSLLCKMIEKYMWKSFLLYMPPEILQLVNEISSFWEAFYKKGVLKNFSKSIGKHKKYSFRGVLSKSVLKSFAKFVESTCSWDFFKKNADWKLAEWQNPTHVFSVNRFNFVRTRFVKNIRKRLFWNTSAINFF